MRISNENSDAAVIGELGRRIERVRLAANLTQQRLAREAGVSRSTVENLEAGRSVTLTNFMRVLRALDLLDRLEALVPDDEPTPMELLQLKGKQRQRARSNPQ